MAFDEQLAGKVRKLLGRKTGLTERKMFGGLAFLVNGNMSVGIHGNELIVRVAPEATDAALKEPGARVFDITGRPMKGWLLVGGPGVRDPESLLKWVRRGADYASSLPKK
jgi:TfoX/Sxy family transcriptional regulator of competence genes